MLIQEAFRALLNALEKVIDEISGYQKIEEMILKLDNDTIDPKMLWHAAVLLSKVYQDEISILSAGKLSKQIDYLAIELYKLIKRQNNTLIPNPTLSVTAGLILMHFIACFQGIYLSEKEGCDVIISLERISVSMLDTLVQSLNNTQPKENGSSDSDLAKRIKEMSATDFGKYTFH